MKACQWLACSCVAVLLCAAPRPVTAQETDAPADDAKKQDAPAPEAQPADKDTPAQEASEPDVTPLEAKVIEVVGDVTQAPAGTSPLDAGAWKPVKVDDALSAGTLIRTGIRSRAIMLFGKENLVSVKAMTLASISDFYQTKDAKVIRMGLGYGTVRGGSTEGTLRSDLIIDSTVATLAKRGTEGWEMQVEPYTGRFTISLAREGLVEALQKATGQRSLVRPGQYATELNIGKMWINQERFDRSVKLVAAESMTTADLDFATAQSRGIGTVAPGAGTEAVSFAQRSPQRDFVVDQVVDQRAQAIRDALPDLIVIEQPVIRRPEGNFGVGHTFRVLVPESNSAKRSHRFLPRPSQDDVNRWMSKRHRTRRN
ncbi:MAG TPA: hypothetical protein VM243_03630 [Phycisphaerae bacterium]|nr:hypothetical protein [Phycisphaerae bacterium]